MIRLRSMTACRCGSTDGSGRGWSPLRRQRSDLRPFQGYYCFRILRQYWSWDCRHKNHRPRIALRASAYGTETIRALINARFCPTISQFGVLRATRSDARLAAEDNTGLWRLLADSNGYLCRQLDCDSLVKNGPALTPHHSSVT